MTALGMAAAPAPAAGRPRAGLRVAAAGVLAERAWLRDPLVLALCGAVAFLCWAGLAARYIWLRPPPDSPIGHLPNALGSAAGEVAIWIALTAAAFEVAWRFPLETLRGRRLLAANAAGVALSAAAVPLYELVLCRAFGRACSYVPLMDFPLRIFTGLLFAFYGAAAVGYGLRCAMRHRQHEIAGSRLEAQLSGARLAALQAQLHPHFLFNTFHSVSALIARDPELAESVLDRLVGLLTLTLERAGVQEVTLAEELGFLEMYAGIEKVRFSDRLRLEVRVDSALGDARVPHLVLQPLVENAIRHGIAARPGPGRVEVSAAADGGRLVLRVADDGCGFHPGGATRGNGVGLANTRARLAQLYGADQAVEIAPAPGGGTVVMVTLPLRRSA